MRNVSDSGNGLDGFLALHLLNKKYDSRTAGNLIKCFQDVINPPKVKDIRQVAPAIETWEAKVNAIRSSYPPEDAPSYGVLTAAFVSMSPKDLQDICFSQDRTGSIEKQFEIMKDKVIQIAIQKCLMSTPTPMDIGNANDHTGGQDDELPPMIPYEQMQSM